LVDYEAEMRAIADRVGEADERYNAIADSMGGKVIGTNIARDLLPGYASGREGRIALVHATGRVGAAYAKDRFWREIQKPGKGRVLLMTAGGVAAGKSTAVDSDLVDGAGLIFDGTLRESEWAIASIKLAIKNGWRVQVRYVQRPLALVAGGAILRAERSGRWGAYATLPATHLGAQESIVRVARAFADHPDFDARFYLNDGLTVDVAPTILELKDVDPGGRYSYNPAYERVSENPKRLEQTSGQGLAGFHWQVEGYSHAEHAAIFRQAVEAGEVEVRILRLLAEGAPSLEALVGKPTEEDKAIPLLSRRPKADPNQGGFDFGENPLTNSTPASNLSTTTASNENKPTNLRPTDAAIGGGDGELFMDGLQADPAKPGAPESVAGGETEAGSGGGVSGSGRPGSGGTGNDLGGVGADGAGVSGGTQAGGPDTAGNSSAGPVGKGGKRDAAGEYATRERPAVGSPERNAIINPARTYAPRQGKERFEKNLTAIQLMRALEGEGRNAR